MVYVISKNGKPLMPCENVIARLLLKSGRAKVKRKRPFTIKLTVETTEYTQPLTLGVDTGSGTAGSAVSDDEGHILYMSEVRLRNDIKKKMDQRREYRRSRRSRKTRYRKCRFLNRRASIRKDRFPPTLISKLHAHIREIEFIKTILPITRLVLECGQFDMQLMKDPSIRCDKKIHWAYQKGPNYGFANTKEMALNRDDYTCQYCKGKRKDSKLEVHHIMFRSQGGSDNQENLITLCHTCHSLLHKGKIKLDKIGVEKGTLSHATQMNIIRSQLLKIYPNAIETFGYVTKENRQYLNLPKEHCIDACVIASCGLPISIQSLLYKKLCVPDGDFQQTKGIRSEQKLNTKKICGFKKFDVVRYYGREYLIKGRMTIGGYAILSDMSGNTVNFEKTTRHGKTVKLCDCKRIQARKSSLIMVASVSDD